MRRVVLELGRTHIHEWEHDGNDAHASELAVSIAEIATDTVIELDRDGSFQLSAYAEDGRVLGSAPVRVPLPDDGQQPQQRAATDSEAGKHNAQLLKHNESLFQRFLQLSEQQANTMGRALDAQGRVLDTLSARLHQTEQQLQGALQRENEAQNITRDALATLDEALKAGGGSGFTRVLEKVGATVELLEKLRHNQGAQDLLQQFLAPAKKLNGQEQPVPTAETPAPATAAAAAESEQP